SRQRLRRGADAVWGEGTDRFELRNRPDERLQSAGGRVSTLAGRGGGVTAYAYLAVAIVAEVIGTAALAASDGFSRLWPSLLTVLAYAVAFYCLSLTLRIIPVGIAYAIWSGAGIVLIGLVGWIFLRQQLDLPALIGMGLIIAGVLVVNLFSNSVLR